MGRLMRDYDWSRSSLGTPENWPHSLQTTVGIILHSAFPMFLFWGKDLLCFYNDAYRPSLGNEGKHPLIAKKGEESWPEIWHFIGPLIEKVMTTGEAVWFEDQFLPIYRNGKMEDVYWTFSYSPAYGDDSSIAGVFVTCTETTSKVTALNDLKATNHKIEKSQEQLLSYFEQSPVAIATISKEHLTFRLVNAFYGELVGRKPEEIENKPLLEALPELKGQGFDDLLREVIATGKPFIAEEAPVVLKRKGGLETIYVNLTYQPQRDTKGDISGILVVATDVTQQVISRKKAEASEVRFRSFIQNAPVAMSMSNGRNCVVEIANDRMFEIWGRKPEDVIGKAIFEAMPEARGQGFEEIINRLFDTGGTFKADEILIHLNRNGKMEPVYLNLVYQPVQDADGTVTGIMQVAIDVTEGVLSKQRIEESEARFRLLIEQAPVATCLFVGREQKITVANDLMLGIWGKSSSVIGMRLEDAVPELKGQPFLRILDDVFTSGKPYSSTAARAELEVDGVLGTYYFNFTYKPLFDVNGDVYGIIDMALDVTDQVIAGKNLEESGARLKTMIDQTPAPTLVLMGDELVVEQINEPMLQMLGRGEEVIGIPLIITMPELAGQYVWEQVQKVYREGISFDQSEVLVTHNRKGLIQDYYYNISYRPLKENGKIIGMIQVAIDVTEQVLARQKIEESEAHLQLTRNAIPAMIFYLDAEQRYRSYNRVFMEWFKINATEALGKTTREFLGETAYQVAEPYLAKAYAGQRVQYHIHAPQRIGSEKWLDIVYTPHKNPDGKITGVIVHATNITEHMLALQKIEESEARFRTLLQEAPVAATLFRGPELIIEIANDLTLKYWGKSKNIIGKPLTEAAPELENQQMIALVRDVYERGGMVSFSETPIRFMEDGVLKDGFYSFSLKALYNSNGEVESILSTGIDVTEQVNVRKQIEQKEKELRDLIAASPIGICVLSGSPLRVGEVNERFLQISGKTREQYAAAPYLEVLEEAAPVFKPILEHVFESGQKYTTEEREMVLVRDGAPENIFLTFEYIPVFEKDKVTRVIMMVVEVTHQVETRKEIERAVVERTKELGESNLRLKRSNEELEQFAYIASHDLQEPVRKISIFTQMLEHSIKEISPRSQDYVSKIYNSTDRMTKLIRDVLAFSRIKEDANDFEPVDLNNIIELLKTDFELQIEETGATVETSGLPVLDAIQPQMIQLFSNLLSNSLKYHKRGVKPVIKISASVAKNDKIAKRMALDRSKKYWHITFSDNGIGFDKDHVDRIFRIFQRLHGKTEFEGTGIGLAICRRIVQSHRGHISAVVGENGGAVFNIVLPFDQDSRDKKDK